jgi:hypothetical protein
MIVNKEIARKLRDIGYTEPTDYLYNHYGEEVRQYRSSGNQDYVDKGYENCDAPDKSDVFAWFRKKGGVGFVQPNSIFDNPGFSFDVNGMYFGHGDTWEEAEDKCIEKMIELHG